MYVNVYGYTVIEMIVIKMFERKTLTKEPEVIDLIPADGKCRRFNELQADCNERGISYRRLRQELKRLEGAGTIIREAVATDRGAGTCYRRNVSLNDKLASELPLSVFAESNIIAHQISQNKDEDNRAMEASRTINIGLEMLKLTIRDELGEYAKNPDTESAEMRLDSVLKDFVLPLIKQLTPYSLVPGALDAKAREIVDRVTIEACMLHDDLWSPGEHTSDSDSS
jgi:hypothetical protein